MKKKELEFLSRCVPDITGEDIARALTDALAVCKDRPTAMPYRMPHYPYSVFIDYFWKRYRDRPANYKQNPFKALTELEVAIGCWPCTSDLQKLLYSLYKHEFIHAYSGVIAKFREQYRGYKVLAVHLSCRKYIDNAMLSAKTFDQKYFFNVIVIGSNKNKYDFDPACNLLTVPALDHYENLSEKIAAVYLFLAFICFNCPIIKIDDDIRCLDSKMLAERVQLLTSSYGFVGKRLEMVEFGISRWWHMGKCYNKYLNNRPYSLLPADSIVEGGCGYALSASAVQILGKSAIYLKDHFSAEKSYEDVAVSKVLRFYGIKPHHYNFVAKRLIESIDL